MSAGSSQSNCLNDDCHYALVSLWICHPDLKHLGQEFDAALPGRQSTASDMDERFDL